MTESLRARWLREVDGSPAVSDSCRVLLLVLHRQMREDGYVAVPRAALAARLGKSERRVSERLQQAVDAGLLARVQRGQKGRTATYRASLPRPLRVTDCSTLTARDRVPDCSTLSPFRVTDCSTQIGGGLQHPDGPFSGTPGGPACSKAGTSADRTSPRSTSGNEQEPQQQTGQGCGPIDLSAVRASWGLPATGTGQ